MNRTEFVVATALVLFAAFLLGWFAHWLLHQFTRASHADLEEIDRMAGALHDAEEARDAALAHLEARERDVRAEARGREADLAAVRDALRDARAEIEELRDYIDRRQAAR